MKKQQSNSVEYLKFKYRAELLQTYFENNDSKEKELEKRLLLKLKKIIDIYETNYEVLEQKTKNYNVTNGIDFWKLFFDKPVMISQLYDEITKYEIDLNLIFEDAKYLDKRSEIELIKDLGIIYVIFGSTYQTILNYHVYRIRFKKQILKEGAFCRVNADIYEDSVKICSDMVIGFWPLSFFDYRCSDLEFSTKESFYKKYCNMCPSIYEVLLKELQNIWNFCFCNQNMVSMIENYINSYIEIFYVHTEHKKLSKEQRSKVIESTERKIDSGEYTHLKCKLSEIQIDSYKQYETLEHFLNESGVVYIVESLGIYIWDYYRKRFGKLVGYEYNMARCRYYLYLL